MISQGYLKWDEFRLLNHIQCSLNGSDCGPVLSESLPLLKPHGRLAASGVSRMKPANKAKWVKWTQMSHMKLANHQVEPTNWSNPQTRQLKTQTVAAFHGLQLPLLYTTLSNLLCRKKTNSCYCIQCNSSHSLLQQVILCDLVHFANVRPPPPTFVETSCHTRSLILTCHRVWVVLDLTVLGSTNHTEGLRCLRRVFI